MTSPELLALLRCPACGAELINASATASDQVADPQEQLGCTRCQTTYDVRAGVPDLLPPELSDDPEWSTWQQHLDAFQARRENRVTDPGNLANRLTISGNPQQTAFAKFTGIRDGVVLDIGCGPGNFRRQLPEAIRYIGMDPIPLPEMADIEFVRGLAEHIPLPDGSVRHITVLSALDHFNDCEAFLHESRRVLEPNGKLHVIQQVHESAWSVRGVAHRVKDMLEDRSIKHDPDVPHHMTEFDSHDLRSTFSGVFAIDNEQLFSASRFAPRRLFLTLSPIRS